MTLCLTAITLMYRTCGMSLSYKTWEIFTTCKFCCTWIMHIYFYIEYCIVILLKSNMLKLYLRSVWGNRKYICYPRYVVTDVLLLADVLEQYRDMCWKRMGLEALAYISLPSLTFDACLKLTRKKLEIVKDIDMLQMIETGIRGWFWMNIRMGFQHLKFNWLFDCGEIAV